MPDSRKSKQQLINELQQLRERVSDLEAELTADESHELDLRPNEDILRGIASAAQDAIVVSDYHGRIIYWNPAAVKIFGYGVADVYGRNLWSVILPNEGRPAFPDGFSGSTLIDRRSLTGDTIEMMFRKHDDASFPGELAWSALQIHGRWHFVGVIRDITDRKNAQQALQDSEHRYRTYVEHAPDGIFIVNADACFVDVNDAACRMSGYGKDELLSQHLSMLACGNERPALLRFDAARRGTRIDEEIPFQRKDGSVIEVSLHAVPISEDRWLAFCSDITVRKMAERELAEKVALEAMLAKISTEFVNLSVTDIDASITRALAEIGDLSGADRSYVFLFSPDKRQCSNTHEWCREGIESQIANLQSLPIEVFTHVPQTLLHGEIFCCHDVSRLGPEAAAEKAEFEAEGIQSLLCVPIASDQNVLGFVGLDAVRERCEWSRDMILVLRAVGECFANALCRKRAEEELRASEQKFRTYVSEAPSAIFITDGDGRLLDVNRAAEEMTGRVASVLKGLSLADLVDSDTLDYLLAEYAQVRQIGPKVVEVMLRRKNGVRLLASLEIVALTGNRFMGFAVDVTETRRLQKLEARAQRLETAGRIAGQVAHDFNNLLGPLMAYPELIRDELESDHPAVRYLDDIERSAEQIADINQQLLSLGRRGHYNLEVLNLNEVIDRAIKELGPLPGTMVIDTRLTADLMNIRGGRAQVHRALSNLIHNARDAMQDIGTITITTENFYVEENAPAFGAVPRGEYVKLTIADSGHGIPEEIVGSIFDPFFSTKPADRKRGSGLGLSVVDAVVKDHHGYLDLSSRVGEGTTFYIYIPITRESSDESGLEPAAGGSERILIVDDDDVQRQVSTRLLQKLGYDVATAAGGEEAVALVRDGRFDLVILDMIMPGGPDGAETYERIRSLTPGQKAIVVSGYAKTDQVQRVLAEGAGAFIKKPLTRRTLAAAVRSELDRRSEKSTSQPS